MSRQRDWVIGAVAKIAADAHRSGETHLYRFPVPDCWGVSLYLKDESGHPTGSLKHRLARSLVLHGIASGRILPGTTLIDATSGSTAISEAYFARMLGLPYLAVLPRATSPAKQLMIERSGGGCVLVDDPSDIYAVAERLGRERDHYYLDQFGMASVVSDWQGTASIAASLFEQMRFEQYPEPTWIVVGAGTGGTSSTFGRYCRFSGRGTQIAVVDPEGSVFFEAWRTGDRQLVGAGSRIEGIGRPRVEPAFVRDVIDLVLPIEDQTSVAATRLIYDVLGRRVGPSTGANLAGALALAREMRGDSIEGSIATLICDSGDRYEETYWDDDWVERQGWSIADGRRTLDLMVAEA